MPSDDDSKIVEDVHIHSEIFGVVEDSLVNPGTPIINKSHVSSAGTSDMDVLVNSLTPISDEIYIHKKNQESQETKIEFIPIVSSSNQSLEFLTMVHQVSSGITSFSVF